MPLGRFRRIPGYDAPAPQQVPSLPRDLDRRAQRLRMRSPNLLGDAAFSPQLAQPPHCAYAPRMLLTPLSSAGEQGYEREKEEDRVMIPSQGPQSKCMSEHFQSQMLRHDGEDDLEREGRGGRRGEGRSRSCCGLDLAHRFALLLGPHCSFGRTRWSLWEGMRRRCRTWLLTILARCFWNLYDME